MGHRSQPSQCMPPTLPRVLLLTRTHQFIRLVSFLDYCHIKIHTFRAEFNSRNWSEKCTWTVLMALSVKTQNFSCITTENSVHLYFWYMYSSSWLFHKSSWIEFGLIKKGFCLVHISLPLSLYLTQTKMNALTIQKEFSKQIRNKISKCHKIRTGRK